MQPLLDFYPLSKAILINYGPKVKLVHADNRVREWHVSKAIADSGDMWDLDTYVWDMILDSGELNNWA